VNQLMLTSEVAEHLRVSEEHVRDLIRRGGLKAYKEGRRGGYRVTMDGVQDYIQARFGSIK